MSGKNVSGEPAVKLLVIDDDPKVPWILSERLPHQYEVISASDGYEGIQLASTEQPPLILLDIMMPGMSGLEVLERLRHAQTSSDIIMLSGHGDTENVVKSIQLGAAEFISKPFDPAEVEIHLRKVLESRALRDENAQLRESLKSRFETLIGDSVAMQRVKGILEEIADSDLTVLIRGESGTGKEVVARLLHAGSARAKEAFTKVNCAAIPRELLEAELFGYERGAFTGANKMKPGRFEAATKGTIFLDEIGEMPLELQSKLLQVLEQQEFVRVGGLQTIKVDVRIVCATNRDLEVAIAERQMRDDLYYRLNEITVTLPSLRERTEDIPLLVSHFIQKYNAAYSKSFAGLSAETMQKLVSYPWPGNVRQLENLVKQIVVRQDEAVIDEILRRPQPAVRLAGAAVNVPEPVAASPEGNGYSLKDRVGAAVAREERNLIADVLRKTNWNRRKAADVLEISYRSLLYKIKEYGLSKSEL
ncbi:MAG: sigma-54-dependent Fis family transcriptional regulator [candidate division Zixibacteria bacterium]|nr:sigma-54-dependent Fis family transcriptional regulator [candidate division Zixibacteria bacterium]